MLRIRGQIFSNKDDIPMEGDIDEHANKWPKSNDVQEMH